MKRLFSTAITGIVILGCWNYSMGQTYVYYVDASALGADDGSNWCDAYVHLEDALDTTVNTDLASHLSQGDDIEIWVADGTYYPPSGSGFQLLPTVRVYGGFGGVSTPAASNCVNDGETLLSQRNPNPVTNGTILSGDIDNATNPDDPDGTINGVNAAVIVRGAPNNDSAILDGFKVIGATQSAIQNGDGLSPSATAYENLWITKNFGSTNGLGMYVFGNGECRVKACIFEENKSPTGGSSGGAIYSESFTQNTIDGCTFLGNEAEGAGGAFACDNNTRLAITNNTLFVDNHAILGSGGAISVVGTECNIRDASFQLNTANGTGGAIDAKSADVVMTQCQFVENAAATGGAINIPHSSSPFVAANCVFIKNHATTTDANGGGGAAWLSTIPGIDIQNCLFASNTSPSNAALFLFGVTGSIKNSTFADNLAQGAAGGIRLAGSSDTTIANSIFWNNKVGTAHNLSDQIMIDSGSSATVTYSCLDDGTDDGSNPYSEATNIDHDPEFEDPDGADNVAGTIDDNYQLMQNSPSIDTGSEAAAPADAGDVDGDNDLGEKTPLDQALNDRVVFAGNLTSDPNACFIDMGAYEYQSLAICDANVFGDMNDDDYVNGLDIQGFVDCFLMSASDQDCLCDRGDFRDLDGVTIGDIAPFVACILSGGSNCDAQYCPAEGGGTRTPPPDCNENGVPDDTDIQVGTSADCNGNGVPDECDIAAATSDDINSNDVPDECEPDCNENGIPDDKDIADCTSDPDCADCDSNGVPDGCDPDCDGDGTPDACETLIDCNSNGIFDACEYDCDNDGVPDECELSGNDCNENGLPDDCEVNRDPPWNLPDCNNNDVPDECELSGNDCNENGILDECDIANSVSDDTNSNGIPDECESQQMMGGGGSSMMMAGGMSSPSLSEADAWAAYFEWCAATDFSSMNHAEIFSACLAKRLELGLPAGQMLP